MKWLARIPTRKYGYVEFTDEATDKDLETAFNREKLMFARYGENEDEKPKYKLEGPATEKQIAALDRYKTEQPELYEEAMIHAGIVEFKEGKVIRHETTKKNCSDAMDYLKNPTKYKGLEYGE